MHLKSMRFWILTYVGMTLFDVIVTYFFVSQIQFGIASESNPLIRGLMGQYGIWQGLMLYVVQEFLIFFLMWGLFYFLISRLVKGKSEELQYKIDILIFNIGAPFIIMASTLLHLFGGIFWILVGLTGHVEIIDPLQLIIYITVICGIFQAYQLYKLNLKAIPVSNQSLVSES